jgi:uncharacterized protein DUF4397
MRKTGFWVLLAAVLMLVAGCHNGGHSQNSTNLRSINAVEASEALDVLVDNDVKVSNLAFGATSPFFSFDSGDHEVTIRGTTSHTVFFDKTLSFGSGSNATLVVTGNRASVSVITLADDPTTNPPSGNFQLRTVGASPDSGPVDVYLTTTADISNTPATIAGAAYLSPTAFTNATGGSYIITMTTSGTKDILFQSGAQNLASGNTYSLLVMPSGGGKLVNALLLQQGQNGTGTLLSNPFGRIKAVNAIPDSTGINFKADGNVLLSNVPFGGNSSYVSVATGARNFAIEASNVPGTSIATLTQQVDPAHDYTLLAANNLATAKLVALTDDNSVPPIGFAKIRFVNALVGSTAVDVLVNFASQTQGLAYTTASSYYTLAPSLTYTITFATPGGVAVIATITNVEIDAGAIYTAYLVGNNNAAQIKLVRDR